MNPRSRERELRAAIGVARENLAAAETRGDTAEAEQLAAGLADLQGKLRRHVANTVAARRLRRNGAAGCNRKTR